MKKIIEFYPAFDKRDDDPKKDYGIHGANLYMALKGELGAVSFTLYTNWHLPSVIEEHKRKQESTVVLERYPFTFVMAPMPADIGYHSPKPMWDDQLPMGVMHTYDDEGERNGTKGEPRPCDLLDGKPCHYDGSSLHAEKYFNILVAEGTEGFWKAMEEYYTNLFGELK